MCPAAIISLLVMLKLTEGYIRGHSSSLDSTRHGNTGVKEQKGEERSKAAVTPSNGCEQKYINKNTSWVSSFGFPD